MAPPDDDDDDDGNNNNNNNAGNTSTSTSTSSNNNNNNNKIVDMPPNERYDPSSDLLRMSSSIYSSRSKNNNDDDLEGNNHSNNTNNIGDNDGGGGEAAAASTITYIDFVPPPPPPVPPPAKYKLWILILVLVFFGVWFSEQANVVQGLTFRGWLSPHAALFLSMNIMVFVFTYSSLDLLVRVCTIHVNGKTYGLEAWLKMGRITEWINNNNNCKCCKGNFFVEMIVIFVQIFEDGFEIFNPTDTLNDESASKDDQQKQQQEFTCCTGGEECQVMLKIQHRVKPTMSKRYDRWQEKIGRRALTQPGLVRTVRERSFDDDQGQCQHTIYLTFTNITALNDWMTSPDRQKLIDELKPMLAVEDVVQLVHNRQLPDAFTDLLVRQGEYVPAMPPKKWKVFWLTSCGLFFTVLIMERILPYYYEKWGIIGGHERLLAFLDALFTTWFTSYVMQPLLIMQFSEWLRRKPDEIIIPTTTTSSTTGTANDDDNNTNDNKNNNNSNQKEPWRTLNDGTQSIWIKLLITVAYFGGCGIKWALTAYST